MAAVVRVHLTVWDVVVEFARLCDLTLRSTVSSRTGGTCDYGVIRFAVREREGERLAGIPQSSAHTIVAEKHLFMPSTTAQWRRMVAPFVVVVAVDKQILHQQVSATHRMTNAIRLRRHIPRAVSMRQKLPSPSYVLENLVGPIDLGWRIWPPTTGLPLLVRRRWTGPQTQLLLAITSAFVIPGPVE